jgi:hypothetical protein
MRKRTETPVRTAAIGLLAAALLLAPAPADAQVYELIKVCKRSWRTALACIVVEKGVEKVVEKSAEDWLAYYRTTKDKPPPAPMPLAKAPPKSPFGDIARQGVDYRSLMRDLDAKIGSAPLGGEKSFVDVLGRKCTLSSGLGCREFKPLFAEPPASTFSGCAVHQTLLTCDADKACRWAAHTCGPRR